MIVVVVVAAESIIEGLVLTAGVVVANRRTDAVAVTIIVRMVGIKMVVPVVGGKVMVRMMPGVVPVIPPSSIRMMPAPSVVEAVMIPSVIIIIRTIVITWPPPIVTHVNA